jgi:prephenate dehydrogenase
MRVGIVGLGLIGGSLGLALRGLRRVEVVGVARTPEGAAAAQQRGAVDNASVDLGTLDTCQLVVIAAPIDEIPRLLDRVSQVAANALITDVASVKAPIVEWAGRLSRPDRFLGGHPVAGRAESGLQASDPALFRDEPWLFTPAVGQDLEPFREWFELVTAIGARPAFLSATDHDRQLAYLSHLAFTASAAFAKTIEERADATLGGPGFRSMVRLAGGDPLMYRSIARENRGPLLEAIDHFAETLQSYRERIAADGDVAELFRAAKHVAV